MMNPKTMLACALVLSGTFAAAYAETVRTVDEICTGDPCVLSRSVVVSSQVLDFGTRTFRITRTGTLGWNAGELTVTAGACDFQTGSKMLELSPTPGPGILWFTCTQSSVFAGTAKVRSGGFGIESNGTQVVSGTIEVRGPQANVIAIDTNGASGDITLTGKILLQPTAALPYGSELRVEAWAGGNLLVGPGAVIRANAKSASPDFDFVNIEADHGSLTFNGTLDARAQSGAYWIAIAAQNDLLVSPQGSINATATAQGAKIGLDSVSGNVTVQGNILAPLTKVASEWTFYSKTQLAVCAGGDILLDGTAININGGYEGGTIILGAGGTAQVGTQTRRTKLFALGGGDIEFCSGNMPVIAVNSIIIPAPRTVGLSNECLSPAYYTFLPCNQ